MCSFYPLAEHYAVCIPFKLNVRKTRPVRAGGKVLGLHFAGCVPLAFYNPYSLKYSVADRRPHLGHFW